MTFPSPSYLFSSSRKVLICQKMGLLFFKPSSYPCVKIQLYPFRQRGQSKETRHVGRQTVQGGKDMGGVQAQAWNCPGQKRKTHTPSWHSELNSQVVTYSLIFFPNKPRKSKRYGSSHGSLTYWLLLGTLLSHSEM